MEEGRILKNSNQAYNSIQKVRDAKALHLTYQCKEIEDVDAAYDSYNMHKTVNAEDILKKRNNKNGKIIHEMGH